MLLDDEYFWWFSKSGSVKIVSCQLDCKRSLCVKLLHIISIFDDWKKIFQIVNTNFTSLRYRLHVIYILWLHFLPVLHPKRYEPLKFDQFVDQVDLAWAPVTAKMPLCVYGWVTFGIVAKCPPANSSPAILFVSFI